MEQELQVGDQGQAAEPLLAFTDRAIEMLKQAMERKGVPAGGIRMTVAGGGCKGSSTVLPLTRQPVRMMSLLCRMGLPRSSTPSALGIYGGRCWIT
jgi:hypothetical protein